MDEEKEKVIIMKKKGFLLKVWNLITNVVMHLIALVLGSALATGQLGLEGIKWLSWLSPAVVPVGWLIIVLTVISAIITLVEFFTNL